MFNQFNSHATSTTSNICKTTTGVVEGLGVQLRAAPLKIEHRHISLIFIALCVVHSYIQYFMHVVLRHR